MKQAEKLLPVAPVSECSVGVKKTVVIAGHALLLVCEKEGCFLTDIYCPHMGARLDGGKVIAGVIQCPHHLYKFDLKSGQCVTRGAFCRNLPTLPTVEEEGWLKVNADRLTALFPDTPPGK